MAAWASLSGYLYFKPGGGALSRLKARKRQWCVLDESRGQLVYHRSEEEARCKPPLGTIDLRGAAISLDLDNQNQFVIIVDNKEIFLTAENHESMMIWLMALQAKRDHFARYEPSDSVNNNNGHGAMTASTSLTDNAGLPSRRTTLGVFGEEEVRERVGVAGPVPGVAGKRSRPSLPHLFHYHYQSHPPRALVSRKSSNSLLPPARPPESRLSEGEEPSEEGHDDPQQQQQQQKEQQQPQQPEPSPRSRHKSTSSSDVAVREGGHKALCATMSLQPDAYPPFGANGNLSASDNISAQMRRLQLSRLGETFDSGHSSYKETPVGGSLPFSRKLSVSMEGTELLHRQSYGVASPGLYSNSHGADINFLSRSVQGPPSRPTPGGETSSESTAESDDVPLDDLPKPRARHSSGHTTASRGSSLSASTDSAIDKGDNGEMAARIQELEKELISSKCELAKVLNRQTCFQDILKQKDEIILDLDERLGKMSGQDTGYDSKKRSNQASKELQERVRILQNQNRFLNEEVRRLARLRSQQQARIGDQDNCLRSLEARVELWKLQYVSLIQSSIRFTGTDTMDDAELSLYGGDRHKNKIRSLLEEARKVNPSLPTFENLSAGEVHVDFYGFKHQFGDCGLLLHYLCQELTQHYLTQAAAYERHQQDWLAYIRNNAKALMKNRKELKELCRQGIPDQHRRQMWRAFIHDSVSELMAEKGPHYYRSLCSMLPDSPLAARYRKQISLDLMRTMPSNIRFSTTGSKGIMDLQDVLLAFCIHNPNVGYCQGMNFLVAMALLFMDAQDAFWTLVAVTERYHTASYFDHNLLGAQADQSVLRDLLADLLPDLARHLAAIDIEISTVTLNWFLAIFFDAVPFQTLLRIWDCFLLEGPKVLFRFSLAILKMHEKEIVQKSETISVMRHLKACARVTYDVDGLVQLAFKGFRPFPRRQDISSKQTVYLKALKEKYRWRELQKLAFAERENLFLSLESETGTDSLTFECCTVTTSDELWVCYGNQSQCKVCVVNCEEGTMTDLPIQFPCRVMAVCALPDAILFGTLSWNVICFRTKDRGQAWEQQVHDAVLSLCQYQDSSTTRVFAGLADGTVAVFEDVSTSASFYDVMYIMIGQSPVTCLRLVDRQLWCACGNTVSIIHAGTLDAMDSFSVSSNPYDHILSLEPGLPGVWVSVRGSSILELWDPAKLCCKMLYDTRAGRYPNLRKDDEVYFNRARITCILPLDYSVWVGTGEGSLITYEVFSHQGSKTPSDSSSFVGSYSEGFSALAAQEDSSNMGLPEGFDPVREAAMRVRSLYLCQSDDDINKTNHTTSSASGSSPTNKAHNSDSSTRNGHSRATWVEPVGNEANQSGSCESVVPLLPEGAEEKRLSVDTSTTESLTPRNDTLSPEYLSAVEDSEVITPTASFCVSEHSAFSTLPAVQDKQSDLASSTNNSEIDAQVGPYLVTNGKDINANVDKMVTSLTDEKDKGDNKNSSENVVSVNEINNRVSHLTKALSKSNQEVVETQREEDLEILKLKSASPKNGMKYTFYLGEHTETTVLSEMDDRPHSTGEGCDNTTQTRESVNSVVNSVNNVNTQSREKVDRPVAASNENQQQDLADANSSVLASSCKEQRQDESQKQTSDICVKQKRKLYRQQTSESSIPEEIEDDEDELASSDNSVIMQIWDALKNSRKNTKESFKSCKESQSRSNDSQSPPYSPTQDSQQEGVDPGASCDLNNFKSYSMGSSQDSQPGGDDVGTTCALKNLNSRSMGSSMNSQHSGSDEVFHDVAEQESQSIDTQSTATDTTVEEHQPDTGEAGSMTKTGSNQSLRDTDNSCASSDEGHKHTARKRPQSLFANRASHRSHKKSTGNVDKLDKSHRCLSSTGVLPLVAAVSSAKRDSTSSITTTTSVDIVDNLQPADPEAQYRLDYTNCHVDTDVDEASLDSRRGSSFTGEGHDDFESRLKVSGWKDYDDGSDSGDVGLRMLDCDPSSFIFPQDVYNLQDPNAAVGRAMLDGSVGVASLSQLLKTPALSTLSCRSWSSYDEVSTPSSLPMGPLGRGGRGHVIMGHLPHTNSQLSMATSVASVASTMELLYAADMTLMSKNKISDKPVKCLLMYMHDGKPLVLSFSGCHDDDEAVLRWTREKDEMLWTNQPILDYNPATKVTTLPSYMKARLSSSSSSKSLTQRLSNSSQ